MWYYPVGHYRFDDTLGLKNGMVYFYDVTAYSAWTDTTEDSNGDQRLQYQELAGRPTATERDAVIPQWQAATGAGGDVYVVPNPYIRGGQPAGWDLTPIRQRPDGHEDRLHEPAPGGLHGEDLHPRRRSGPDAEER